MTNRSRWRLGVCGHEPHAVIVGTGAEAPDLGGGVVGSAGGADQQERGVDGDDGGLVLTRCEPVGQGEGPEGLGGCSEAGGSRHPTLG